MTDNLAPVIVRIIMRYLSGALVAWGLITPELGASILADKDLQQVLLIVVGGAIGGITEMIYRHARKTGGST